jgi:hypothetical protein
MNYDLYAPRRARVNLNAALSEMEQAQLIRALQESEPAYWFKHALVQDTLYSSLMKQERKRLHQLVAETLEHASAEMRDESAALLARHFELAEDAPRALAYFGRAAEWAQRTAAHREETALLEHAIALAEQTNARAELADLHARRGKAFTHLTEFRQARAELLAALELVPSDDLARRAEILNDLSVTVQWLFDNAAATQYARQALHLAEQAGREDLAAQAMSALAVAMISDGDVRAGLEYFARAFERGGAMRPGALAQSLEFSGLASYWIGEYAQAAARIQDALTYARENADSFVIMRGLGNLGMVLVGQGKYRQAMETFRAAREFGRKQGVTAFLSRALAMEAGMYLDLFDYGRAEEIALEARAAARAANFPASATNAAIDLMINYARRGEFYLAAQYVRQVEEVIPQTYGGHRWLFEMRLAYARAELALAQMQWESALARANDAVAQARKYGRIKYETLGLIAGAKAHAAMQHHDAADKALQQALQRARADGNPSLFLQAAVPLYYRQYSIGLYHEIRATIQRIRAELPEEALRERFDATVSEWV